MASGGGEQSSREDCSEECRRQTNCPANPDATLRSMTSRSTVARPVDREAVIDCLGTSGKSGPRDQAVLLFHNP